MNLVFIAQTSETIVVDSPEGNNELDNLFPANNMVVFLLVRDQASLAQSPPHSLVSIEPMRGSRQTVTSVNSSSIIPPLTEDVD